LGDEGGTGTTSGNKNGCGDHLHFAKQSSAAAGGTSVSVSFSDVAVNTGNTGCYKTYAGKQAVPACNL
jgi:hypothetical protein